MKFCYLAFLNLLIFSSLVFISSPQGYAQNNNGRVGVGGVGGIVVDAEGIVRQIDPVARKELATLRAKALGTVPADLQAPTALRMVSLRQLQETIAEHLQQNKRLPTEVLALAGLQRIQYVFADPANKDIVIAGPPKVGKSPRGEPGWCEVAPSGDAVG